jgi:hypothetical protein
MGEHPYWLIEAENLVVVSILLLDWKHIIKECNEFYWDQSGKLLRYY